MLRFLKKSDAKICADVMDEIERDWRIDPAELGVQVNRGIVTLNGTVRSWSEREAADEDAHRVRGGVREVVNHLRVE
jgi:osmotically-inducible protein OsmY